MKLANRAAVRRRRIRSTIFRAASYLFLALGLLAVGYSVYVVVDAQAYQAYEQAKFERVSTEEPSPPLVEGGVIGEIQVPRLHLKAIVVQGDSHTILRRAVGHIPETALPGKPGNVALAGHRDTFFRPLRDIRLGDEIRFKTYARSFDYVVESIEVVEPRDMSVLESSSGHELTLLTCFPVYYVGPAPRRLVVRAREVDATPRE